MSQEEHDAYLDPDEDGVLHPDDCDDSDPTVGTLAWYQDGDGDGFGDAARSITQCEPPEGYVASDADCDDGDPAIHPDAEESCDGQDQDCDDVIDEDGVDPQTYFRDGDRDGYGLAEDSTQACALPEGYAREAGDCDDSAATAYPGNEPVCGDGVDNDCDGLGDCGLALEGAGQVGDERVRFVGDGDHPIDAAVVCAADFSGDGGIDWVVGSRDGQGVEDVAGAGLLFTGPVEGSLSPEDAAFRLLGERTSDQVGASIGAADMDGDGQADLLLGAPEAYGDDQGAVYITLGPIIEDIELAQATSVIRLYSLYEGDQLGEAMLVDDLDQDGAVDLIVGAPGADNGRGAVHFIEGPIPRRSARVDDLRDGALYFPLQAGLGGQVEPAGDVDGDGRTDLLFPMPDYGDGLGALITDLPTGDVNLDDLYRATFVDQSGQERGFATTLTGAGDVDGDGLDDVVVGAPLHSEGANTEAGIAWLIPGSVLVTLNRELVDHEADAVAIFSGAADTVNLGAAAHGPGDLNDDGAAELLIGAPGLDNVGAMLLYQGPLEGTLEPEDADYRFVGVTNRTQLGAALTDVGDVDGLGLPELIVAAPEDADGSLFVLPADGL